ncbi:putative nucleotidyltransferase, ribonuclease H [Tanacetum coccineum]
MGYSTIASSLTDLLKKNKAWIWDEGCQAAFESLKKAVIEEQMLRLPDVTMPFELHTDASDFAIGGVLMQDGYPIAFESRKLNETERKYTVQEKEMTAEGLEHDSLAKKIIALAKDKRTQRFWLKRDMLFTKGDRIYVPKWGNLRREILKECHDSKWAGHLRITRTLALDRGKEVGRIARAFTDAQGTIGDCFDGLYHMLAKVGRRWKYYSGGGSILKDGVVQDHGDGFELLYEFSSPNRRANGEGECTIGALSLALWKSPFELVTGRQPLTPNALAASYEGSSLAAYKTIKEWHEQADLARASLDKAAKKMKKWADEKRRHNEFEVGDQVMVKLLPQQFKSLRKVHKELIRRYEGPFPMIGRVGKEILSDRMIRRRGVPSYKEYLIKWRDLPDNEASWEVEDLLWQLTDKIKRYHKDGTARTSRA